MLVINVKYFMKPGMRDAFYEAITAEGIDVASRRETACRKYDYSFPADTPDILLLDEIWDTAEDQVAHCQTAHFARLGELKAQYVNDVQLDKFDVDLDRLEDNLKKKQYAVTFVDSKKEAAEYLNEKIDGKTVGMGGSMSLDEIGFSKKLAQHNQVFWHQHLAPGADAKDIMDQAATADVYIASANGVAETGELINIDGRGNRLSASLFGHKKVYFVIGLNKIRPDLAGAIGRARSIAAPRNAKRLNCVTPCAVDGVCHDCSSPNRICNAMTVHMGKMIGMDMEVVIVRDLLGY